MKKTKNIDIPRFRVWDKKSKRMADVIVLNHPNHLGCCEYALGQSSDSVVQVRYDDCEIMQYIDVHDKFGKEICEGDILEEGEYCNGLKMKRRFIIMKGGGCLGKCIGFVAHSMHPYPFNERKFLSHIQINDKLGCKIIGNIYQNPELIINKEVKE